MKAFCESLALALAVTGVLWATPIHAADESPWAEDTRSAVRLIGASARNGELRAGIEIKLQPGWKTYWRYPGDSGVPPRFDFSGSDNLRAAKVSWPAPHAFTDETGTSIGYKGAVVFPLRVTPRQAGKPVTLRMKIEYAVCEKLCIPAEGRAELTLGGAGTAYDSALADAEAQVPQSVGAKAAGLTARRVSKALKPLVAVDIASPPSAKNLEVFVEGPNAEWALPIPTPAQGAPAGYRSFGFTLEGLPPGVDPMGPFELTFTVVGGERPIEVTTHLD